MSSQLNLDVEEADQDPGTEVGEGIPKSMHPPDESRDAQGEPSEPESREDSPDLPLRDVQPAENGVDAIAAKHNHQKDDKLLSGEAKEPFLSEETRKVWKRNRSGDGDEVEVGESAIEEASAGEDHGEENAKADENDSIVFGESTFLIYAMVLLVVCVNCFFNTLQCEFVFDDNKAVVTNMDLRPSTPLLDLFKNDFWGTPLFSDRSHKSYRPLTILSFRLDYLLWGLNPGGYHMINMVLHWVLCVLILRVFKLFLSEWFSFILALLFAVHPVHTDAVSSIVGRAETLAAIFAVSGLWSYSKASGYHRTTTDWNKIGLTIALVIMATLCKEQGITIIAVCCAYEVLWLQKINLWDGLDLLKVMTTTPQKIPLWFASSLYRMLALLSATALLVALRIIIMGAHLPYFVRYDNPIAFAPTPSKQLSLAYLFPLNLWLLLNPHCLLCDWSGSTVTLIESFTDPRNLATLNFLGGLGALTYLALTGRSKLCRQLSMALAFLVFPFLPASNIFFCVGFVIAERILYTPSIGFCMLVVIGIQQLSKQKKYKHFLYLCLALTVTLHAGRTARRNVDWKDRDSVFKAALLMTSKNAKMWINYGHRFEQKKEYEKALACYNASFASEYAIESGIYTEMGRLYFSMEDDVNAEKYLTLSQSLMAPSYKNERYQQKYVQTFYYLAMIKMKTESKRPEAENLLKKAIRLNHQFEDPYKQLGELYTTMGEYPKAIGILKKYLSIDPRSCNILNALAMIYHKGGKTDEALKHFEQCLQYKPDDEHAQYMAASIIEFSADGVVSGETLSLIERFKEMAETSKGNKAPHYLKIGELYRKMEEFDKAIHYYSLALEILPNDGKILSAMGITYKRMNRSDIAYSYLSRVTTLYPNDAMAWQRLAQVYVDGLNQLQNGLAAFQKCLEIDPGNIDCEHNTCVVLVKAKQYADGEVCLSTLAEKYPDNESIKTNLERVRGAIARIEAQKKEKEEKLSILEV